MTENNLSCSCGRSWRPEQVLDLLRHLALVHDKWVPVLVVITEFTDWQKKHRLGKRGRKPRSGRSGAER